MIKYKFYKRNKELACEISEGSVVYFLNYQDAKKSLFKLSKRGFNNIYADNYRVTFATSNMQIIIEDFTNVLLEYLSYGGYDLICDIKKAMRKKLKTKNVMRLKKNTKSFVCAAGVMTLLLFGTKNTAFGAGLDDSTEILPIELDLEDNTKASDYSVPDIIKELEGQVDKIIDEYNKEDTDKEKNITQSFDHAVLNIECVDNSESDDVSYVSETYGDIISKYSMTYGVSADIVTAMITQESHGIGGNLMQIVYNSHVDEVKSVYNFDEGKKEKFVITYNPDTYYNNDYIIYDISSLKDPDLNIKCGISILASYYQTYCKNNPLAALICYNQGPGAMQKFVDDAAIENEVLANDILTNPNDISYLQHVHQAKTGDPYYIEHVMQYVKDDGEGLYMLNVSENTIFENRVYIEKSSSKTR